MRFGPQDRVAGQEFGEPGGREQGTALERSFRACQAVSALISGLVPRFLKLLESPLTVLCARRCLRSVVLLVVPPQAVRRRDLLPDALLVIAKRWLNRGGVAATGGLPACEEVLSSVDAQQRLSGPTQALATWRVEWRVEAMSIHV